MTALTKECSFIKGLNVGRFYSVDVHLWWSLWGWNAIMKVFNLVKEDE